MGVSIDSLNGQQADTSACHLLLLGLLVWRLQICLCFWPQEICYLRLQLFLDRGPVGPLQAALHTSLEGPKLCMVPAALPQLSVQSSYAGP